MDNSELLIPNNIIFCERRWKLLASGIGALAFFTFIWGFIIIGSFLDDNDFDEYSISAMDGGMAGMLNTAGNSVQLQQLASPAVVSVITTNNQQQSLVSGSGVIIHPQGYILTNLHSVDTPQDIAISIQTANGPKLYKVEIIKTHKPHDLALLKIVSNERFLFLKLADTQALQNNTPVMILGRNINGRAVSTSGNLLQQDMQVMIGNNTMTHLIRSDAPASWQQGGGPMVNSKAELVGLNLIVNNNNSSESYAIPAHVIKSHFQDIITFTSNVDRQNNTVSKASTNQSSGLGKIAAAWWGKASDLQSQQHSVGTSNGNTHPATTFGGFGVNVAVPPPTDIAPQDTGLVTAQPPVPQPPNQSITPAIDNAQVAHIGSAGDMVTLIDLEHESGFDIGGYKLDAMFGLALLGLVGGIVGALMPMGGSIVVVVGMMMFFSYGLFLIRPVIYITNLFTYGIPAYRFMQKGLTMRDHLYPLFTWVAVGVLIGYFIGHNMNDHFVGYLIGLFALSLAGVALYDRHEKDEEVATVTEVKPKNNTEALNVFLDKVAIENEASDKDNMLQSAIMGAPLGLLTGLIGVSGGLLEIFYQRRYANISYSNALANASVMVFVASLTAAVVSFLYGTSIGAFSWQTPLTLAMILVPSAFAGGILGHSLCEKLTKLQRRYGFAGCMLIITFTMFFAQ